MSYRKLLSTRTPGCILLLIDQSGSMRAHLVSPHGPEKAAECARGVNRTLRDLVLACRNGEAIIDRCFVGVIGYGGRGVRSAFQGALHGRELIPISQIADSPLYTRVTDDDVSIVNPVWIEPMADGGTPMTEALQLAAQWTGAWAKRYPDSFPPVVINITDGVPDNEDSANLAAAAIRAVETSDGNAILLNAHLASRPAPPLIFPSTEDVLPDHCARLFFRMASVLPEPLRASAANHGLDTTAESRGLIYYADADLLLRVLNLVSLPTRFGSSFPAALRQADDPADPILGQSLPASNASDNPPAIRLNSPHFPPDESFGPRGSHSRPFPPGIPPRRRRPRLPNTAAFATAAGAAAVAGTPIAGPIVSAIGMLVAALVGKAMGTALPLDAALTQDLRRQQLTLSGLYRHGPRRVRVLINRGDSFWTIESEAPQHNELSGDDIDDWLYGDLVDFQLPAVGLGGAS